MSTITVNVSGPLFSKKIDHVIKSAIVAEALMKVEERIKRPGRKAGRRLNRLTSRINGLTLTVDSTVRAKGSRRQSFPTFGRGAGRRVNPDFNPRATGKAWMRKHVGSGDYGKGIIGQMLPRVLRKTTARIVGELS